MTFRKRVTLFAATGDFVVCDMHREEAVSRLADGTVEVSAYSVTGMVSAMRLTGKGAANTAKPGAFGVVNERLDTGHRTYKFLPTWERVLCRG
jgi:hypothetical protein